MPDPTVAADVIKPRRRRGKQEENEEGPGACELRGLVGWSKWRWVPPPQEELLTAPRDARKVPLGGRHLHQAV